MALLSVYDRCQLQLVEAILSQPGLQPLQGSAIHKFLQVTLHNLSVADCGQYKNAQGRKEEEEESYKLRPANKTDHLCQSWQYCHMFMKFRQFIT